MLEFVELTEKEYQDYQACSPQANFLNSVEAIHVKEMNGWKVEYVGVKKDGVLVAATPLVSAQALKIYRYYSAQKGYLMDYDDDEVLSFFTEKIKEYLKKRNAIYLQISPVLQHFERDSDGKIVEGGIDHSDVCKKLEKLGYIHRGFTLNFPADTEHRWQYVLDLGDMDEKALLNHFTQNTRYAINKTLKQAIEVRQLGRDELNLFLDMLKNTAENKGFDNLMKQDAYFYDMFDAYGEHMKVYLAQINTEEYEKRIQHEIHQLNTTIDDLTKKMETQSNVKKLQNQIREYQSQIQSNEKRLKEIVNLREKHGSIIPISSAMFFVYPNEMVYLHAGSYDEFRKFDGPYAIQWETIRYALAHHIPRYNFYGISGDFTENATDAGPYLYKKGYNGYVWENIGDFFLPIQPFVYKAYRKLHPIPKGEYDAD